MGEASNTPFRVELIRKAIHLCSLSIPVLYYSLSKSTALTILIPLTAGFVIVDVLRYYHQPSSKLFHTLFGWLLREHEFGKKVKTLNGGTYMLVSATICILIFPKLIVITAFAVLIIADSAAALVGHRFGRHKITVGRPRSKSIEGSAAFLLSSTVVVFVTPKVANMPGEYIIGIIAAVIGMFAEAFSADLLDDNLAVPLSIGFSMWAMYLLLLPNLNIYQLDG
ncbi:MAG: dolichol kinase [Bacteroidota bacterium]